MDLTAFLSARLDEDEQVASVLMPSDRAGEPYSDGSGIADRDWFPSYPWGAEEGELEFMAGPGHPARVLADVEAKRQVMAVHKPVQFTAVDLGIVDATVCWICHSRLDEPDGWPDEDDTWSFPLVQDPYPCTTLRLLAVPNAGHPDYREEWRP